MITDYASDWTVICCSNVFCCVFYSSIYHLNWERPNPLCHLHGILDLTRRHSFLIDHNLLKPSSTRRPIFWYISSRFVGNLLHHCSAHLPKAAKLGSSSGFFRSGIIRSYHPKPITCSTIFFSKCILKTFFVFIKPFSLWFHHFCCRPKVSKH